MRVNTDKKTSVVDADGTVTATMPNDPGMKMTGDTPQANRLAHAAAPSSNVVEMGSAESLAEIDAKDEEAKEKANSELATATPSSFMEGLMDELEKLKTDDQRLLKLRYQYGSDQSPPTFITAYLVGTVYMAIYST